MSLIDKLESAGLKINESNERKIDNEIKYLGYLKMSKLLKLSNDIGNIINIYKYDCKLSSFFWKHIRRVETNFKALLINYFLEQGDPIYVDSKIEENNKKNKTKKVNKNFALKYLLYKGNDSKRDKKTYKISKDIIINSHLKKNSSKNIINILANMSLGKILDFFNTMDSEKILIFDEIVKYRELRKLVKIRNRIAHHELLSNNYSQYDFKDFWNIIKNLSVKTEKTKKNDKEIEYLLKNMYN